MLSIWILTFFVMASRNADIKAIRSSVGSSRSFAVGWHITCKSFSPSFGAITTQITSHAFVTFSMQVFLSSGIASSHVVDSWNVSGVRSSLYEYLAIFAIPLLKSATTSSDTSGISSVWTSSCEPPLPIPLQHPGVQLASASLSVCGVSGAKVSCSSLLE